MKTALKYLTPVLAAAAAAVAIAAAPIASAAPTSCFDAGNATQCQTPGNAEISATTPVQGGPFGTYGPFFSYDRGRR
jgi:hypothetical protein